MKTITDLKPQRGRLNRFNLFLNGQFAFSLGAEAVQQACLEIGQSLSQAQTDALAAADERQRCRDAALRLFSYRARSRKELSDRLMRRGFGHEVVTETLTRLEETGMVDDAAFAKAWKEDRQTFSPRSGHLIAAELRRKGVAAELACQTAREVDEDTAAYQAALKKARALAAADRQTFRRRLGDYLRRRGFSYDVIALTVERLWRENSLPQSTPGFD